MGRGAKIFLISALFSACVFGLISFVIISGVKDGSQAPNGVRNSGLNTPVGDADSSFNLLCLVTEEDGRPLSAVMLRADRERNEYTFTPICLATVVGSSDLRARYFSGGISELKKAVWELTGIEIGMYAVVSVDTAVECIESIGDVGFTFTADMKPNGEFLEAGARELTARDTRLLLRYDCGENSYREQNASAILRALCERLAKPDGASCYAAIEKNINTNFTYDMFAARYELISAYPNLAKTELTLCGEYKGEGEDRYFIADVTANLDKFSEYRKYYN